MYKFNSSTNELEKVSESTFLKSELKERNNIQEWIRKDPSILDEDLVIIAHEYDKFDVNERLDLLALDKDGNVVIIEVKRDYTGGNVDFQALKYCSYCSTLKPADILEIYEEYLRKFNSNENAADNLIEFFEVESEDLLNGILNSGQRIIIIGREIDKRILSVSAWLSQNNIDIKCMTIVPYLVEKTNDLFIDVNKLIPTYSINDYFINKRKTDKSKGKLLQGDDVVNFFTTIVETLNKQGYNSYYYSLKSYARLDSIKDGFGFVLGYAKRERVFKISIESSNREVSKKLLNIFNTHKIEIESKFDKELEVVEGVKNSDWLRIFYKIDYDDNKKLSEYVELVSGKCNEFIEIFKKYVLQ